MWGFRRHWSSPRSVGRRDPSDGSTWGHGRGLHCHPWVLTTEGDEGSVAHFCLIVFVLDKCNILFLLYWFFSGHTFIFFFTCIVSDSDYILFALCVGGKWSDFHTRVSFFKCMSPFLLRDNFWRMNHWGGNRWWFPSLLSSCLGHFCCYCCSFRAEPALLYLFCPWKYKKSLKTTGNRRARGEGEGEGMWVFFLVGLNKTPLEV